MLKKLQIKKPRLSLQTSKIWASLVDVIGQSQKQSSLLPVSRAMLGGGLMLNSTKKNFRQQFLVQFL